MGKWKSIVTALCMTLLFIAAPFHAAVRANQPLPSESAEAKGRKTESPDRKQVQQWLKEIEQIVMSPLWWAQKTELYLKLYQAGNLIAALFLEEAAISWDNKEEEIRWEKISKDNNVVTLIREEAQSNAFAQAILGDIYYDPLAGVAQNKKEAFLWYHKSAQGNSLYGQVCLADLYYDGSWAGKNYQEAARWYRQAAEHGYARAQNSLGVMCANGHGVAKDERQAVEWFQKAAAQGQVSAQYSMGVMYADGRGVAKDERQALEWFQKAAAQGHADAKAKVEQLVADLARDSVSILPLPIVKAAFLDRNKLRQRAEAGEGALWLQLSRLYALSGQSYQAKEAAEKAAQTGLAAGIAFEALGRLVNARDEGEKAGAAKEVKKVWPSLKTAADGGNAEALNVMGEMYLRGWQTVADPSMLRGLFGSALADPEPDLNKALERFQKSAAAGDPFGRLALGRMYFTGQGVKEDARAAEKLFRQADPFNGLVWGLQPLAEKGQVKAQMALADLYGRRGEMEKSLEWTKKAAETGHPEALFHMGRFWAFGAGGLQANVAEAAKFYQRAAEAGYDQAYFFLALASADSGNFTQARRHLESGKRAGLPDESIRTAAAKIDDAERSHRERAEAEQKRAREEREREEQRARACSHVYVGKTFGRRVNSWLFGYREIDVQCTVIGFSPQTERVTVSYYDRLQSTRETRELGCSDVPR